MGEASHKFAERNSQAIYTRDVARRVIFYNGSQSSFVQCLYRQYTEILSLLYLSFFLHTVVAGSPLFFIATILLILGTNAVPSFALGGVTGNSFICWSLARVGRVVGITFI